tara:strand:+ start:319 stop:615 length:297 start_codon:yes stop_codon:yes gene_type:complete
METIKILTGVADNGTTMQTRTVAKPDVVDIEFGVIYDALQNQFEWFDARLVEIPPQRLSRLLLVDMIRNNLANVAFNAVAMERLTRELEAEIERREKK